MHLVTVLTSTVQMEDRRRKTRLKSSPARICSLVSCSVTILAIFGAISHCSANDDDLEPHFALRPFQASPHLTRRQDGAHHPSHAELSEPNLVPILTAPVARGSSANPRPSFQRIRINKPQSPQRQARPQPSLPPPPPPSHEFATRFTSNEGPLANFQRVTGFTNEPPQTAISSPVNVAASHPPVFQNPPQRQSFRRVKPPSGGTRRIKLKPNNAMLSPLTPSRPVANSQRVPNPVPVNVQNTPTGERLRGRGPITAQDDDLSHKHNALDNEEDTSINTESSSFFGNRLSPSESAGFGDNGILAIESMSRSSAFEPARTSSPPVVQTPTIPVTYYTTYTYFTTVVRGQHTALLSREQVSSTTQIKPIDRSIVTAIEFNDGYIQPSRTQVPLGTKTKGLTTTIYNVASRVQVFNDDLYKVIFATNSKEMPVPVSSVPPVHLEPTRLSSSVTPIEPTRVLAEELPSSSLKPKPSNLPVKLENLENEPKKQVAKFTYFYTFIDGAQTRYSTRTEESTANFVGNLATLSSSLAASIDNQGLLEIISPTSTVALGSRAHGRLTTVVNLALNNYVQFDNVKGASLHIEPTRPVSSVLQSTQAVSISSSFQPSESESVSSAQPTPTEAIPSASPSQLATPPLSLQTPVSSSLPVSTPALVASSRVVRPSRIRSGSSRRPGIRIKVKPIRSKLVHHISRLSSKVPIASSAVITSSSTPAVSSTALNSLLTPAIVDQTPTTNVISSSSVMEETTPTLTSEIVTTPTVPHRKKVAFTVRRPGFSGVNRFFSRRPSSQLVRASSTFALSSSSLEMTSSPLVSSEIIVSSSVLPSSSLPVEPTPSFVSSSLPSSSTTESLTELSSSEVVLAPSSSLVPSKPSRQRYVVTRIGGALNKWSPIYASRIRVSSRKIFKSTSVEQPNVASPSAVEPTSRLETVYETTTHTVPFTIGSSTIYTTVEETNSRVITKSESALVSPSFEPSSSMDISSSVQTTPLSSAFETSTPDMSLYHTQHVSDSSVVSNSEETLSSVPSMDKASPVVVVETSDVLATSTLYSTYTYFATLFNGTQTTITPLEEVKTEYLTLREPVTITRTILADLPSSSIAPTSSTAPQASTILVEPSSSSSEPSNEQSFITETYSTHTTLTHFITLFSGSHTILSSIEEISPTVMTSTRAIVATTEMSSSSLVPSSTSISSVQSETVSDVMATVSSEWPSSSTIDSSLSGDLAVTSVATSSPTLASTSNVVEYSSEDMSSSELVLIEPSSTLINGQSGSTSTAAVIEPGSVIELNDLLEGVQDAGQIGETIKDIVNNIVTGSNQDNSDQSNEEAGTTMSTNEENDPSMMTTFFETTIAPSFSTTSNKQATPSLNKNRAPVYVASQNLPKYYETSRSEDKSIVIFSTQSEGSESEPTVSTRFVTSIDKSIRTLTLTSTKVYYTRDSPLTITSLLTTTLPPITYVSTIIGSKTILGTYNSITPTKTETSTSHMETQSVSSVVTPSSTVLPVASTRPRLHRPKSNEPTVVKAKVTPFLTGRKPAKASTTTPVPPLFMNVTSVDIQLCNPSCNVTNKEYCREGDNGVFSCECRPGYVRRPSDNLCQEIKNYLVMVRVSKTAESEVASISSSSSPGELQNYARVARRQVGKNSGIAGLQVLAVEHSARARGALVNMTIQMDHHANNVHDELSKKLERLGHVEKVIDFDECSSPVHNDCSPRAQCINEPGSYRCQCVEPYIDLDQTMPGRLCVSEVKSCDYCHGRGDCWRNRSDTVCRCHPMFIGRRCEINGLLLAILVPIVAILVIVAIICFLYCSRKWRQRNRRFKNLAAYGPVAVIGSTLDRKAMLETSSESSDPQHRSPHYTSESNPASARGSMARRHGSRRESEPSLDRSLASYSATGSHYNSLPPQILIPRARPPYSLHPGQVYMW